MSLEAAFGQILQRMRKAKNLSQEDVAFASQIERAHLSRLENGKKEPGLTTLFRLAAAFGVPASRIVAEVEELIGQDRSDL